MIVLRKVSLHYGQLLAVHDISLTINQGEAVAIEGPSGSGKTTLLRLIAGLETPDDGEIELDGRLASSANTSLPPHQRNIGFAFQQPALWPHLTIARNIAFPIGDWPQRQRDERVRDLLAAVDLTPLADRLPAEISGGEARRVSLARAIAAKPKRLLLDEPLVNVDPAQRDRLLAHVREAASNFGATLVYVSHEPSEAARFARRLRMDRGSLYED